MLLFTCCALIIRLFHEQLRMVGRKLRTVLSRLTLNRSYGLHSQSRWVIKSACLLLTCLILTRVMDSKTLAILKKTSYHTTRAIHHSHECLKWEIMDGHSQNGTLRCLSHFRLSSVCPQLLWVATQSAFIITKKQ